MDITLTDFVDFVSLTGSKKLNKVREIKERDEYHPKTDYYKSMRDGIKDMHVKKTGSNRIENMISFVEDESKKKSFESILKGYLKFLGRKKIEYFKPPKKNWKHNELNLRLNPELGLLINDVPHILKLHFKKNKIEREKVNSIVCFMENEFNTGIPKKCQFCVLDVPNSKIFYKDKRLRDYMPLIYGEADAFISMWNRV